MLKTQIVRIRRLSGQRGNVAVKQVGRESGVHGSGRTPSEHHASSDLPKGTTSSPAQEDPLLFGKRFAPAHSAKMWGIRMPIRLHGHLKQMWTFQ